MHTNRLIDETSPYLRQHAHNPVDWYPWGEEALRRARSEGMPILLSIGYAACHWCHVMEHESFEDEDTARQMNEHFVCVKVDREERPDLDSIYMQATQLMSGHGGWPMTVFLTPEGVPYYAGTYFPPEPRHGMPSFRQLLASMADAWSSRREDVEDNARKMHEALRRMASMEGREQPLSRAVIDAAASEVARRFDGRNGGFGGAPKFPQSMTMSMLLRHHARTNSAKSLQMVAFTLRRMARGGIYDQLGGGFARYSVDEYWLVPHFEKMLYDNALLTDLLVETWQASGEEPLKRVACETIDYVLRDMTHPEGGFYATEDADSEGEEGRFYVWTPAQIEEALGDKRAADLVCQYYDVGPHGNFEHGTSILNVPADDDVVAAKAGVKTAELMAVVKEARGRLFAARSQRVRPGRDEKIITAWNGLMLHALSVAGAVFERDDYLEAARRNASFLLEHLMIDGRVMRVHKDGQTKLNGYLEDYAALANGLISLYEATFEPRWVEAARDVLGTMLDRFRDEEKGGFFFTSSDHEELITRFKDPYDNATPSGTSLAAMALLRMGALTGDDRWRTPAEQVLAQMQDFMLKAPTGFGLLLCALDFATGEPAEIAIVGQPDDPRTKALRRAVFAKLVPNKVVAGMAPGEAPAVPLLEGKTLVGDSPAAYVCRNFTCEAPVTDPASLRL